MRLTTRTNLAVRTLMACAVNPGRILRKQEIAAMCNASENHLAQVIQTLSQLGYVETLRGRHGGLRLAGAAGAIGLGDLFRAFEGVLPFAECFEGSANTCPLIESCRLREALCDALDAFYGALDRLTLEDLVARNDGLQRLLCLNDAAPAPRCPAAMHPA
ncbi:MAG: Rrf2 family transcriptional regulator [Paracoccaceae bacterium]